MKTTTKCLLVVLASSLLLAGCCTQRNVTAAQWEYKVAYRPGDTSSEEKFLNDMGKNGWVLVQMTESRYFFKRPK